MVRPITAITFGALLTASALLPAQEQRLPATEPLTIEGDIAGHLVDGVDRFLLRKIDASVADRSQHWHRDASSHDAWNQSIQPNRERLSRITGTRDARVRFDAPEVVAALGESHRIASGRDYDVLAVRWPVLSDPDPGRSAVSFYGEGLLLVPTKNAANAAATIDVIAIPDADQTPEMIAGLVDGVDSESQFARRLVESGCRVLIPTLVSRTMTARLGRSNLSHREFLYRSAFELGRHLIGYELQTVLAGVDWFEKSSVEDSSIGVIGYGEGGQLALLAGALDTRIDSICVSGYFGPREAGWQEPLDRNVFGLLQQFGGAELLSMVAPRRFVIDASPGPVVTLAGDRGGAPAELRPIPQADIQRELQRTETLISPLGDAQTFNASPPLTTTNPFCGTAVLSAFITSLGSQLSTVTLAPLKVERNVNAAAREQRLIDAIDRHNQLLLRESPYVRKEYFKRLDTSSLSNFEQSIEAYRTAFRDDVIGSFDDLLLPFNARSRQSWDTEHWTGHEVVLDVFPDVIAYGVLLIPKNLSPNERRPVVVCQHGLEGRPTDVFLNDHYAYHDFAAKLCEQGYITFAPQNLYLFKDRFRTLQRKANPLGKTLFSIIVPQHQQIVNWLKTLPFVDDDRIAFYGLSYGGKSAMRIPALVTDYCLSICSADFNEWVLKNASTRDPFSYVWTGEYEIFEFDLGSTFNYAEMATLIAPRPFMVERGHFDGVGTDEWVGYEFGKVRNLYAARLGIGDRCEIEWFVGPHTINGKGTFAFLQRHLGRLAEPAN